MPNRLVEYQEADTTLEGYLAWEGDGPKPAVLVAHDWSGRRPHMTAIADRIAALGYTAFAIDMYGKGKLGSDTDNALNESLMMPLVKDRALLRARVNAGLDAARAQAEVDADRVAAIGYCFGGLTVLNLARSGATTKGVVSIHGLLGDPNDEGGPAITSKVLVLHGHDDPMTKPEKVLEFQKEMTDAGVDWQVHSYGGTKHAFTNEKANAPEMGLQYNAAADKRSWASVQAFLAEVLA